MGTHLIAAVDYSSATDAVVEAASDLARALGGGLTLVHVAAGEPVIAGYDKDDISTFTRDDRAEQLIGEHAELRERAEALQAQGVPAEALLVMGDTVEKLLDVARRKDAAMVVIGSHGRSGLHHLLLGSISEAVVRRADRPVLVVPVRSH